MKTYEELNALDNGALSRLAATRIKGWVEIRPRDQRDGPLWSSTVYFVDATVRVRDYSPATSHKQSAELFMGLSGDQKAAVESQLVDVWLRMPDSNHPGDMYFNPRKLTIACLLAKGVE